MPVIGFLPPLAAPHRRALVEPVIQVLACAATHARVTVVASWGEVVVGAVGDGVLPHIPTPDGAAPDGLASNVEVGWEQDGDRVWAQARWTAASR